MVNNLESKYGDDEKFEAWTDVNIFIPIAHQLVDPLYNIGFTPNMVTILSTLFTFLSIYFLHLNKRKHAFLSYIFGYTLDCVDGKMARKYSMSTEFGMILDSTSDNIASTCLFIYIICSRPFNKKNIFLYSTIFLMSYLLSLSYGLNEAITSFKETGSDNFYERRKKQLEDKGCGIEYILNQIYILINKTSYQSYKRYFKTYDEKKIYSKLRILKHFGPGNYCLYIGFLLLYI